MDTDMFCTYDGRRDDAIVGYLYDDMNSADRAAFERHLPGCRICRSELDELSALRAELAEWTAPEAAEGVGGTAPRRAFRLVPPASSASGWRSIADAPIWAQAAAAMLVVGASLGLANIDLAYSPQAGLSVRTGWMQPVSPSPAAPATTLTAVPPAETAPWRAELSALEERLGAELRTRSTAPPSSDDEAIVRRVRALIQDSERRQQRELALRVAEIARDAQVQRQADLVRIDRSLGLIQSRTGVEVMRTQQQLNSLAQRVSQRQ